MMRIRCAIAVLIGLMWVGLGAGCAQGPAGLPASITGELKEPERLPQGTYSLVREWEAESAPHMTGRAVDDADAEGGKALEARPAVDEPNTLLYGPYLEVEPGSYVAFFRVKLLEPIEDDLAGTLDACVSFAQEILGAWDLAGTDLTVDDYVQVPVGFVYPGGQLECRFTWYGDVLLRVDRVSLYRVEGADLSREGWRVPEAKPTGLPKDLAYYTEERPSPDIFPRSKPPAKTLAVFDARKQRADMRLLIYSLQGLVNRTQPRLYCLSVMTDPFWLERMHAQGWIERTQTIDDPAALLKRFQESYQGVVVTDPLLPATKNVATMVASVKDGLVASPRLANELGLPVLEDLRGRWTTSAEAYRWAFDNLWPELNHHVIACSWPRHLALRDYLVQHKVFIFWLSGPLDGAREYASPDAEVALMEELLAKMPVNIPVMSYPWAGKGVGIGEGPGVSLFAEFGKYLVGSIDCPNLSVRSGLPLPEPKQKPAPPAPELQRDKVYFSFIISDGDNLPVLTTGNFPQLWEDKLRGEFPIGWTLSPSAPLLIPDVVDYYYRTATPNDHFIGAVSGVGYTYPDLYGKRYRDPDRHRIYDGFLDQTAEYMRRSDLDSVWIMNATQPDVIARYAERIPFLESLFPDYGRRVPPGQDPTYPTARNVPVFHAVGAWRMDATREERLAELVADVRRMTPPQRPAFLHVFALNWFTDLPLLQATLEELGPEYIAVRPDHLAQLWRQAMAEQQVLVRLPYVAAGIEGLDLLLRGSARNMTNEPVAVRFGVEEGLAGAQLTPEQVRLQPGQEVAVLAAGSPAGDRVRLSVGGPFGTREAAVTLRTIPQDQILGDLPPDGRLVPATYLEAETLAHRSGEAEDDPDASEGSLWVAREETAEPGYVVFGPYTPLDTGRYLAMFRLKRLGEGAGLLAEVDTCVGGGNPQTGVRRVRAEELPEGEFRWVVVAFEHPGGNFETRVVWSGSAPLAVDCVAVWEIAGR